VAGLGEALINSRSRRPAPSKPSFVLCLGMAISNLSFRHATEGSNEESAFDFAALTSTTWKQPWKGGASPPHEANREGHDFKSCRSLRKRNRASAPEVILYGNGRSRQSRFICATNPPRYPVILHPIPPPSPFSFQQLTTAQSPNPPLNPYFAPSAVISMRHPLCLQ
jgi:hypothetical protein